ncbi:hypothetical protein JCM33374_g728 [Metschnikowia sp. JCM 33374]|nr:hypothetical protein JCM33374_g728 [Metschnikowia sp. JCM 33374]
MVLTETNISSEEYLSIFKSTKHDIGAGNFSHSDNISPMPREIKTSQGSRGTTTSKEGNRPPPPPPSKTDRLPPTPQESPLPDVTFSNDHFSFEDGEFASYQYKDEPSSSSGTSNGLSQKFKEKMVISSKKALNRPRPPPLESPPKQSSPSNEPQVKRAPPSVPDWQSQNQIPFDPNEHEYQNDSANLHPEGSQKQYQEPFERYNTPFDREQQNASLEPFDNYPIPEEHKAGGEKQLLNQQRNNPEIYRDDFHQPHNADDEQSNEIGRQVPPIHTSKDSNSNQSNMSPKFPLQKHNVSSKNSDRMIYDHNQRNVSGYAQPHTQVHHDPHSLKDEVIRPQDQERQTHVSYLEENMTESSLGSKGNFKSDIQKEGDSDKFEMKKKKPGNDLENTLDNVPDGHPPPFIGSGSDDESSTPRYNTTHSEHENRGQPAMTSNETVQGNGKFQSSSQSNYPTPISQDYVDPKTGPFPEGERKQDSDSDKLRSTPRLPIISQSHEYSTEPPSQKAVYPESSFANSPVIRVNPDSNQAFYSQNSVSSSGQPYMEPSYHYSNAPGVNSDVYPEVTSKHGYQVYNSEENIERINNVPQRQIPGSHYVESQPAASRNPSSTNHHGHVHLPYQQSYQSGPTTDQQEPSQEVGNWQRQTQNGARVVSAGQFQLGKMQQMHHGQGLSGQEHSRAPSKAHSLPGHAMPLPYKPNQMMPVQPLPGQHIQGTHMAGQPMSGQPMPVNLGQSFNGQPAPQYYYPTPPQGYYTATPQGYGYPQPPQMYYPPPGGFYPPQPYHQATPPAKTKPSTSELTMMSMPSANAFKKNSKPNKANLRAALNQGTFGI